MATGSGTICDKWGPTNTATDSSVRYHQAHLKVTYNSVHDKVTYTVNGYARSGNGGGYNYMINYGVTVTLYYKLGNGSWTSLGSTYGILNSNDNVANITKTVVINKTHSTQTINFKAVNTGNSLYTATTEAGSSSISAKTSYTVSYNANGGSGAPATQTKWYNETLTLSSTKPSRTGYTFFDQWADSKDVDADIYISGHNYTANKSITLYALWLEKSYSVIYNANGGTGTPSTQTKWYTRDLTLTSTKPTKTSTAVATYTVNYNANNRSGAIIPITSTTTKEMLNYTFNKWNTEKGGGGTDYSSGAVYKTNATATLYARWTTSTSISPVTLPLGTCTGYTFGGWYTTSACTTPSKVSDANAKYTPKTNVTLYAKWTANKYNVAFNPNGGTFKNQTSTTSVVGAYDVPFTANNPTRLGHTFSGWNIEGMDKCTHTYGTETTTATAISGVTATTFKNLRATPGTVTCTAQWNQDEYTISYSLNGRNGDTPSSDSQKTYGSSITLPAAVTTDDETVIDSFIITIYSEEENSNEENSNSTIISTITSTTVDATRKIKYTFNNWNTKQDGTGTRYQPSSKYNVTASATLYAQWNQVYVTNSVTLNIPTKDGYEFKGWFDSFDSNGKNIISPPSDTSVETISYTPPGNIDLYEQWIPLTYTVRYDGEPKAYDNEGNLVNLQNFEISNLPKEQTIFISPSESNIVTIASDVPTAKNLISDNSNIITYVYQDENNTIEEVQTGNNAEFLREWYWNNNIYSSGVNYPELETTPTVITLSSVWDADSPDTNGVYLKEPSRIGYSFKGWYTDRISEDNNKIEPDDDETNWKTFTANTVLYAHWDIIEHQIKYNGDSTIINMPQNLTGGKYGDILKIDYTNPIKEGETNTYTAKIDYKDGSSALISSEYVAVKNYSFKEWNTHEEDELGIVYKEGEKQYYDTTLDVDITGAVDTGTMVVLNLYPKWNVTYSTPTIYLPILESEENKFFAGWYSNEQYTEDSYIGLGNRYYSLPPTGDITYYAKWIQDKYTIKYDANGGDNAPEDQIKDYGIAAHIGQAPTTTPEDQTYTVNFDANLMAYTGNIDSQITTITYVFNNWNTQQNGTGIAYFPYTESPSEDQMPNEYSNNSHVTLYAQWNKQVTTPTLPIPTVESETSTVESDTSTVESEFGYTFEGWYRDPQCLAKFGNAGEEYIPSNNMTLYGKWLIKTYQITYNVSQGYRAPKNQIKKHDEDITLSSLKPRRSKSVFKYWIAREDNTETIYNPGDEYSENKDLSLYPEWRDIETLSEWISDWETTTPTRTIINSGIDEKAGNDLRWLKEGVPTNNE